MTNYNKDSGKFFSTRYKKEKEVGYIRSNGYIYVRDNGKEYLAHRLAWLKTYGQINKGMEIDHINHNKLDNRIENLREVTSSENQRNRPLQKNSRTGFNGVNWSEKNKAYVAKIWINNKSIVLGQSVDINEAIDLRKKANIQYGFHENHGENKDYVKNCKFKKGPECVSK